MHQENHSLVWKRWVFLTNFSQCELQKNCWSYLSFNQIGIKNLSSPAIEAHNVRLLHYQHDTNESNANNINMVNKELIEEKYRDMKDRGATDDFLEFEAFGQLKIFINHKPKFTIVTLPIEEDMVYVGIENLGV